KDSPRIWASTAHGISCFDPNTNQFQNYDLKDGLQDNEFNVRAAAREEDGRLIFGGVNGYNRFYPHELSPNKQAPPVVINGFRLNNQQVDFRNSPTLSAPIEFVDEIQLQHSDNIFSFEFTALDYTNPLKNQFRYRLQGFSDKWVDCGNEKKATFTNLPAGNYTFEVEASNNDGVWNNQSTSLRLSIKPALWASWWAKMIYFFGILSLLWFAWRTWRNRMRMQEKLRLEKLHAERYQELEQLKSQFFAGISHEFRTPLSLIIGPLEKMRKEIQSEVGQRNVEMIHRNAHRLLRLVNQLLVVAGLEEGKLHLHPSEQDLNLFIRQIIASFRPGAEEKGLELQYIGTENPVILCFDIENFEHIFYNLLANALRFTARGGKILVRTFASQTQVSIQVSDTGIGIPIEVQARLFERFYQVPGEQSAGGTGLGLALVKELTELHQGKVSVESSPGKGTVFTLVFPFQNGLKAQKVQPTQVATLPINRPKASKTTENDPEKRIILIVEDNADLRTFIRSELEQEFAILEANQGEEGLQMATEHVPDLIISDVMMPVMDGIKMSYALKSKAVTSHIPIIMLTARTAELSRIEGLQAGADDYLTKPFSATELRLRIQNRFFYLQKVAERLKAAPSELQEMSVPVKRENQFLKGVQLELEKALDNSDFSVEELAAAVNLSRKQLYRKIKALTQKTPSQFMRSFRLQKGQELLQSASLNVSQVAYSVGFSSPSYFSRCFQEEFGYSPSETKKDH
ncbi:MAG TPA: response regulator, partial [Bacteroidetes bacterium]|nr:response regulator [Bacteroidota bacterium]